MGIGLKTRKRFYPKESEGIKRSKEIYKFPFTFGRTFRF